MPRRSHSAGLGLPIRGLPVVVLTLYLAGAAWAQNVVVIVNGEPITSIDIDQRSRLVMLSSHKKPNRDEVRDELINDKLKIKEAKKFGLELKPADVETAYASMATRLRVTPEQLTRQLESSGVRPETLKARLKADLVWTQLVRGRFQQNLIVGERDILNVGDSKGTEQNYEYTMRPIVLVVPRGSPNAAYDVRRKEAEAVRDRVQGCAQAIEIFQTMRNVAVREPVKKTSADLAPSLRAILDKTPVGKTTPPEITRQGVEVVALCERNATTADTPQKREAREKLFAQKYEAQAKKYLDEIRRSAMIEYR